MDDITLVYRLREEGHDLPVVLVRSNRVTVDLPGVVLLAMPFDHVVDAVRQGAEGGAPSPG